MSSSLFAHSPKIAVIGGGLSGLTAAYRLNAQGYDVSVYEARARAGGRVFTISIDGHIGELGGQNILDGGESKNILGLIDELHLTRENKFFRLKYNFMSEDGKVTKLFSNITPEELNERFEKVPETAKNMKEVLDVIYEKDTPEYKALSVLLNGYEGGPYQKLSSLSKNTLYHLILGSHPAQENENLVEHSCVKGGNHKLCEALVNKLQSKIFLNHILKSIEWNQGKYFLTFQNGKQITADILVLTIPCPVYKNIIISEKVLPSRKVNDICKILYGSISKIIIPVQKDSNDEFYLNKRLVVFPNHFIDCINMYYVGNYASFDTSNIEKKYEADLPLVKLGYQITNENSPVIANDELFGLYTTPVGHNWVDDPFALGSYSCLAAGQEDLFTSTETYKNETVKSLFAPVNDTLFFAGEHTSTLSHGTMESAVESGEKVARMIINNEY